MSVASAPERRSASEGTHARHVIVLVNETAGEVLQSGRARFIGEIESLFHDLGVTARVLMAAGEALEQEARAAAAMMPDWPLIVAGGDGTFSRMLPLLIELKRPVGMLPLGTLNLIARDVGLEGALPDLVRRLAGATPRPIDLGFVDDVPFHSNVGLGFLSRMAREREGARRRYPFSKVFGFTVAAMRSIMATRPIEVELDVDGRRMLEVADAVLITNNHFEGSPWRRPRLDEGLLEVHLLRSEGLRARLRAAYAVWTGRWRELPTLRSASCRRVVIHRKTRRTRTVAMDGEIHRVRFPLAVRSAPGALLMLSAQDSEPS